MGRRGRKRRGLRAEPPEGWPLDQVLVGVATLRTLRELFRHRAGPADPAGPAAPAPRAWDLALWSGVTAQGSTEAMRRLFRAELVDEVPPDRTHRAVGYRLDRSHPLVRPLSRLFELELEVSRKDLIGHAERAALARRRRRGDAG